MIEFQHFGVTLAAINARVLGQESGNPCPLLSLVASIVPAHSYELSLSRFRILGVALAHVFAVVGATRLGVLKAHN